MGRDRVVRRTYQVLYFIAILVLLGIAVLWTDVFNSSLDFKIRRFSDNWIDQNGQRVDLDDIYTREYGGTVIVERDLPHSIYTDDALCFQSQNVNVKIWIDDVRVYDFEAKPNLTGAGYGIAFHSVGLDKHDINQKIRIQFSGVLGERPISGYVKRICIGSESNFIRDFLKDKFLMGLISVTLILIGAIIAMLHFWIPDKKSIPFNILSLGISAVMLGAWSLVDSNILQLITGKIYLWRILNRTLIFFVGYPLVSFFISLTKVKRIIYRHIEFAVSMILMVLIIALRYLAGIDFINSFIVILAIYISITFIIIIVQMLDNRYYCIRMELENDTRFYNVAYILIFASFFIDYVISRITKNGVDSYGTFSRIGLLLFVIIVMWQFLKWWTKDQASVEYERFINRSLQFAVSSNTPEESIRLLLEYLGNQTAAKRTYIFEDKKNGMLHGTYEWFAEGMDPRAKELLDVPIEGMGEKLINVFNEFKRCFIVKDINIYENTEPEIFDLLKKNEVERVVLGPLESNGEYLGFIGIDNAPEENLEEISELMGMLAYFFTQFIMQRNEQSRLVYYSYYDVISGARNRSSFKEFCDTKLNMSQAFGYAICQINELKAINDAYGHEAGDQIVKDVSKSLIDIFGDGNVYRISGEEFICFGFESDETFFNNDIARVRRMILQKDCVVFFGTVFCANGTTNLELVKTRAAEILAEDRDRYYKGNEN